MVTLKAKKAIVKYALVWVIILDVLFLVFIALCWFDILGCGPNTFGIYCIIFLILLVLIPHLILTLRFLKKKESKTTVKTREKEDRKKDLCPMCGAKIVDGSGGFCSKCGSPIK